VAVRTGAGYRRRRSTYGEDEDEEQLAINKRMMELRLIKKHRALEREEAEKAEARRLYREYVEQMQFKQDYERRRTVTLQKGRIALWAKRTNNRKRPKGQQ